MILRTSAHVHTIYNVYTYVVKKRNTKKLSVIEVLGNMSVFKHNHTLLPSSSSAWCNAAAFHTASSFKASSIFRVILCPSAIRVWLYFASGTADVRDLMSTAVLSRMHPAGEIMHPTRVMGKSSVTGPLKQKVRYNIKKKCYVWEWAFRWLCIIKSWKSIISGGNKGETTL